MSLQNYTGQNIGLADRNGNPKTVLPPSGRAEVVPGGEELLKLDDGIPVYWRERGKVRYLPRPERADDLYIVTKEVAETAKGTRFDLVIAEDPFEYEGSKFYRTLIRI